MRIFFTMLLMAIGVLVIGCTTTETIAPDGSVTKVTKLDKETLVDLVEKGVDEYNKNKGKDDKAATSSGNAVQDYISALENKVDKMPDGAEKDKLKEIIAKAKEQLAKT